METKRLKELFDQEGFVVVRGILPPALLDEATRVTDEVIAGLPPDVRMDSILFPHIDPKLWNKDNLLSNDWARCSLHHRFFLRLAAEPVILDLVEALLGPDIALFSTHLFPKAPLDGTSKPWHQDAYYYDVSRPDHVLTVWLALDESTTENGCLEVYPGSHKMGLLEHRKVYFPENARYCSVLDPKDVPGPPVPIELQPGDCEIHHSLLVHGSQPNKSSRRRAGHTMTYIPARTEVFKRNPYPLYLLRGKAVPGVNTYVNLD